MVSCDGHSSTSRNSWPHTFVFTILSAGMVCRTALFVLKKSDKKAKR